MTLKQEQEVEGEPLSSGVKKSFIVAAIANVNESHHIIQLMLEQINFWDCECKFCNDLKVARYLCGMMQGQPMYPCPYCEVDKDNLDSVGELRTIRSLFQNYEDYRGFCVNNNLVTKKQKKAVCKNFKSFENKPLFSFKKMILLTETR